MALMAFHVGDTVKLKSGGPVMTVEKDVSSTDLVECCWFDGKEVRRGQFPYKTLEGVKRGYGPGYGPELPN